MGSVRHSAKSGPMQLLRLVLAVLLIVGCDTSAPPNGQEHSARTIRSRRDEGWPAERAWRLVVTGQIGGALGAGQEFGRVVDVAIDPAGRVWVADGLQQQIRVFEPNGTFVRSVGRKGSGPAEFLSIAGFDWAPDGTLWVVDGGNARFAVYDTAGQLVATHPRMSTATLAPWPGGFDRHGRLADLGGRQTMGADKVMSLIRISPDRRSVDTLRLPPLREEYFGEITSGDARTRHVRQAPVPFTATQIWGMDPEGYAWIAVTDRYRLERRGFDGQVERVVELQNTPRKVSRAEREQILKNYAWFEQAGGKLDPSRIPDRHPHLQNLFFDDDAHIWVLPTYFQAEKPKIDIFALNGRYLGQFQSPVSFLSRPAPAIRGETVVAVARDSDGVDSVVLMRLHKSPQ